MKLFVWADPYHISYGSSALFVVADDLEQAKKLAATKGSRYAFTEFHHGDGAMEHIKLGEPIRIVDLPCAEWHEWSE